MVQIVKVVADSAFELCVVAFLRLILVAIGDYWQACEVVAGMVIRNAGFAAIRGGIVNITVVDRCSIHAFPEIIQVEVHRALQALGGIGDLGVGETVVDDDVDIAFGGALEMISVLAMRAGGGVEVGDTERNLGWGILNAEFVIVQTVV
ncbi:MAG: hypothetical protein GY938_02990 [Ketobacter sp.]|nr:hypothetical protein [Ketobacter sp.]